MKDIVKDWTFGQWLVVLAAGGVLFRLGIPGRMILTCLTAAALALKVCVRGQPHQGAVHFYLAV